MEKENNKSYALLSFGKPKFLCFGKKNIISGSNTIGIINLSTVFKNKKLLENRFKMNLPSNIVIGFVRERVFVRM